MKKFIPLLMLATACQTGYVRNDKVEVRSIDAPTSIETDEWLPSREYLIEPIITSIEKQSSEFLPFDEPRTEYGQQDGKLRPNWEHAYLHKRRFYVFNGDRYPTVVKNNAPFVPQVCADFIVDTIDRAAGTWYRPSLKRPGKDIGRFHFRQMIIDAGLYPRRVGDLVKYFKQNPDDFEFVFEGQGAAVGDVKSLKQFFKQEDAKIGDIIFISGKVPWDKVNEHQHSFFVTGYDENGFVEYVTGNPVYPVKRSLKVEGGRSPERKVTHIIRMTRTFLEKLR